jgi:hypothetical protein
MSRRERREAVKRAIYEEVLDEIRHGESLLNACKCVGRSNNRTAKSVEYIYYNMGGNTISPHGHSLLTFQQEAILLGLLLAFSAVGNPLTAPEFKTHAELMLQKPISEATAWRWLATHDQEVSKRKTKKLAGKRADPWSIHEAKMFCASLSTSLDYFIMTGKNCVNYDETRIVLGTGGNVRLERKDKNRPEALGKRDDVLGTLVIFASAAGEVLMSVIILKAEEDPDRDLVTATFVVPDRQYVLRGQHPRFFAVTTSGYTSTPTNRLILAKFRAIWQLRYPGLHCYLFSDQLSSHYNTELVRENLEGGVHLWSLVANTSHITQPLDDVCFARFKQELYRRVRGVEFVGLLFTSDYKDEVYSALYDVEETVFTPRLLNRAFLNTGLFPFNPEKVLRLVKENVGVFETEEPSLAEEASQVMVSVLRHHQNSKPRNQCKRKRGKVSLNGLHSPHQLLAFEGEKEWKKREKEEEREQKRLKKMEEDELKKDDRAKRTCEEPSCSTVHQSSKQWFICDSCFGHLCPKHKRFAGKHTCD